ncbi:hypothetical protein BJI67_00635 [Acidihalobacter aeolianus]|uniref:Uncharacterized protein n=1 Tax=Acidihalobacter aeolianus TaxID=2792603 RepID=A0A1D8K474_9GAMM|nr:hypothetical protein [Acidihalobacter aeolianus]AOV15762.1 hypothetical protein BJI67_00635 [Acidihalobacter aeolianus]
MSGASVSAPLPAQLPQALTRLCIAMLFALLTVDVVATLAMHWMLHWPLHSLADWPQALAGVYVAAEFPWYVIQHGVTSVFGLTAFEDRLIEPYQGSMPIEMLAIAIPVAWVILSYLGVLWLAARGRRLADVSGAPPYTLRGLAVGMGFALLYVVAILLTVHIAVDGFAVLDFKLLAR